MLSATLATADLNSSYLAVAIEVDPTTDAEVILVKKMRKLQLKI